MRNKTISIIGLGYIGLPTAALIASKGFKVLGVDINPHVVNTVNQGRVHIIEPDLEAVINRTVGQGLLRASTAVQPADVFILAVPTPFNDDKSGDVSYIAAAAKAMAPHVKKGDLVILESTSPVGTTEHLASWLADLRPDLKWSSHPSVLIPDVHIAYCPERVLPGRVLYELVHNDRVIGGLTSMCSQKAYDFYSLFVEGECVIANARTAEMAKLAENSFRDVNIAYANELSMICDDLNINVWELISLTNRHPRVNILNPGPGVGGHCIAVDPWFIIAQSPERAKLMKVARNVNDFKPQWVIQKVMDAVKTYVRLNKNSNIKPKIACYGLTFKADIDDIRESPALHIVEHLTSILDDNQLWVVEPNIDQLPKTLSHQTQWVTLDEALALADIHVLLVDHKSFKDVSPPSGLVVDTKGIWTYVSEVSVRDSEKGLPTFAQSYPLNLGNLRAY